MALLAKPTSGVFHRLVGVDGPGGLEVVGDGGVGGHGRGKERGGRLGRGGRLRLLLLPHQERPPLQDPGRRPPPGLRRRQRRVHERGRHGGKEPELEPRLFCRFSRRRLLTFFRANQMMRLCSRNLLTEVASGSLLELIIINQAANINVYLIR